MRLHKKIHLWWGTWWAVQLVLVADEMSAGVRINIRRPLLDVYLGPLTIAIGRHAAYTDPRTRTWDSCRGMLFPDDPHHPLDAVSARVL